MDIDRYKNAYSNWRKNPFTGEDLAVDKVEDGLYIPDSAPFLIQLLEVPRKNDPTSVAVRCYDVKTDVDQDSAAAQAVLYVASTTGFAADNLIIIDRGGAREEEKVVLSVQLDVSLTLTTNLAYAHTAAQADDVEKYINFTEVLTAPAQSQFRVDYPPTDGEGTGLVEFNQNDTGKEVRVSYKATGSSMLAEFLDTKISYPAGDPLDNQIIAFKSNLPEYRVNPIRYFHEGSVIYHVSGEDESCLLFRFKKSANESKVFLELKGAKLHQGYYTELKEHLHAKGTLAGSQPTHTHAKGTLAGSQPTHIHAKGTLAITGSTGNQSVNHVHGVDIWSGLPYFSDHTTEAKLETGTAAAHYHRVSGDTGGISANHNHPAGTLAISGDVAAGGGDAVTIAGETALGGGDAVTISGETANAGGSPKAYPDSFKIYADGVDKSASFLTKSGLGALGDGTSGHAFVTTGSNEVDISDWITTDGIHELKITAPIAGNGGRCLLHIELT